MLLTHIVRACAGVPDATLLRACEDAAAARAPLTLVRLTLGAALTCVKHRTLLQAHSIPQ